jgi:hypothetical protein
MGKGMTYAERKAAGLRRVEVWLPRDVWDMLEELKGDDGTQAEAVIWAIREAYERRDAK